MRKVLAFLVWLFSFWTWKDFFLRWLRRSPFHPTNEETAGLEHLPSQEGPPESGLARFLSSLPENERWCRLIIIDGDSNVTLTFGPNWEKYDVDMQAGYSEILQAVASSKIVFHKKLVVRSMKDDSLKHMEAFGDALRQSGSAFTKLELDCRRASAIPSAKCLSNVLLGIDAIQDLYLCITSAIGEISQEETTEFMAVVAVPHILRNLKGFRFNAYDYCSDWDSKQLIEPFNSPDSVLEQFDVGYILSDVQLQHLSNWLATSISLKSLSFNKLDGDKNEFMRGYTSLALVLCSNQSLQFLQCGLSSSIELKTLLDPLMPKANNLQSNTTLTGLELSGSIGGKEGIKILVDMLRSNMSLLDFSLCLLDEFSSEDVEASENILAILKALKTNKYLKSIDFGLNSGVGGYKVLGGMMDLLLENNFIEDIFLDDTPLDESRDAKYIYSELSKRKRVKLWDIVQGMANVKPTSGRIFLCGQPFAGKTQLRLSIKQSKEFQHNNEVQNSSKGIRTKMHKALKWREATTKPKEDMLLERTQGIEVDNVFCNDIHISIWDMAGQTDYHSFHELVMPNFSADGSCSIFLLMCNPMEHTNLHKRRRPEKVKAELETWLRFIASNTRRSYSYRPHVSIVMTHFDYWKDDGAFVARIEEEVTNLRLQFQEVLEFDDDKIAFKVNGKDVTDASNVFDFIKSYLKQLLERLPKTISACEEVQHLIAQWNANKAQPLLKWDDFCESMCKDVEDFKNENQELAKRRKEFVAIALSDGGHIIYDENEGVVITNPHWFCHDIMGQFLHQCTNKGFELDMILSNGIISIDHVKCFMLNLLPKEGDTNKKFDDILKMMKKLHICYEQDTNCILIPSTLKEPNEMLSWYTIDESTSFKYVGRRLACQDQLKTMLTAGFFTRLQVSLFEMLQSKNDQRTYKVFRDVIKFITIGIEVIVQFNDGDIDILSCSNQSQDKMLAFLEINIIDHIKHLQEDPTLGCPGVQLTEYIMRPECVKKLLSPMNRKTQVVHVKDLEVEVLNHGADARHSWGSCEGLDVGYDTVKILLGDMAYQDFLGRRKNQLQEFDKKIQSLDFSTQNDPSFYNNKRVDVSTNKHWQMPWYHRNRDVMVRLQNLEDNIIQKNKQGDDEIMSKLNIIVEMIQKLEHGIKDMQKELLDKVCSRIDDVMAFSVEMKCSKIPKVAYLSEIGNQKLLTRFVPGLNKMKLRLMCESIHGFHRVANQEGWVVNFGTEDTRRFLAMTMYGLKIFTILTKIGAHVACGMGAMVPDLSEGFNLATSVLDSSGLLDYPIPTLTLESLPLEARNDSGLSIDDTSDAQRWLRDFLEPKCENKSEFYEKFKLRRVKYRSSRRRSIAWICDDCLSKEEDLKDVLN